MYTINYLKNMKKKLIYALTGFFLMGAAGCSKLEDFGDTNVNPAATTEPILAALLTNAQASMGAYASQTRGGLYAQYFSETQYTDVSLYSIPQLSFTGEYSGTLNDLQMIINKNTNKNMSTVAKILQQYVFWHITDRWGDVPYSEALTGKSTPKYDSQEEIYKGMIAKLKAAVNEFDNSLITGDVLCNGDVAQWKRVANSMRLLMSLQLSKRYPAADGYAALEFKSALADAAGVITTNAQNFKVDYPGGNYKNNWWNAYNGRKDYAESKTMTDLLSSLGDSRANVFGGVTEIQGAANSATASTVGMPYGIVRASAEAFTSANAGWARILRGDFRTEDADVVLISAGQIALARAEAADKGWTAESLSTMYTTGITLAFEQWGLSVPANYLAQGTVALGAAGTATNAGKIATQRYISFYPNGLQGWNIWRKTGFPALTPAPDATNDPKEIPRRYTYASSESTTNGANLQAAVTRQFGTANLTGDKMNARVWWDVAN
jgi:hypothetical protein